MPYYQLYYHLVWSTKNRYPFLTSKVEPIIYGYLRTKAAGLDGVVLAVGGIENHVHVVASIPPKISVSDFVGQLKGVASARFNKEHPGNVSFAWQAEYGAFTFDRKRLPNVMAYVEQQKEHHAQNNLIPILERIDGEAPSLVFRESAAHYNVNSTGWWQEIMELDIE
jgi:putative transposase